MTSRYLFAGTRTSPGDASRLVAEGVGTFLFFVVGVGSVVAQAYSGAAGGGGLVAVALAHVLVLVGFVPPLRSVS